MQAMTFVKLCTLLAIWLFFLFQQFVLANDKASTKALYYFPFPSQTANIDENVSMP